MSPICYIKLNTPTFDYDYGGDEDDDDDDDGDGDGDDGDDEEEEEDDDFRLVFVFRRQQAEWIQPLSHRWASCGAMNELLRLELAPNSGLRYMVI